MSVNDNRLYKGYVTGVIPDEDQFSKKFDNPVTAPSHYLIEGLGECRHFIAGLGLNFFVGNAFKYIWRAGRKTEDPLEDLKKARENLDFEIKRLEKNRV